VKAGESTIVELALDEKKIPCLIHAIDLDPVTDRYQHVDFYALDMKKEVTTHVPIHFVGESPAVKTLGGVLVTVMSTITVTCLPKDLPHAFDVDISALAEFHNSITVGSLKAPAGVTIKDATDSVIVTVQEPRAAEEEKPAEAAAAEGAAPAAEGAEAPAADVALKKEEGK
jgi:large subunit ribosomal protein L25